MDSGRHVTARSLVRQLGRWRLGSGGTAYADLAERVKLLVLDGRLPVDTRLPAERELAGALAVSRTTVAAGYELLRTDGFLRSRRGAGSWITMPRPAAGRAVSSYAPSTDPSAFDLAYAAPPAPHEALARAQAGAAAELSRYSIGSGYHMLGVDSLRDAVAARFTARGLPTDRDQILITCGAQQAISIVLAAVVAPGERVVVEHPTYPNALDAIGREHARAVPIGFEGPAWNLEALAATVRDTSPRLIYLIPDHQNPTGRVMDSDQRAELVALARRTRTPLLVDETMVELALEGTRVEPVAAHLAPNSSLPVITVGSASKTFWGGLRTGWIRAAPPWIERFARARASLDIATSVLDQLVTGQLLSGIDGVLADRLPNLRTNRDHLLVRLRERFPSWRAQRPLGGLSLWVDLGRPVSSALVSAAARRDVLLAAGPRFGVDGAFEQRLRLPYTLPEHTLDRALDRLADAWAALPTDAHLGAGWTGTPAEVA
jgi:DNA-binding transcriptional MocR family regulator